MILKTKALFTCAIHLAAIITTCLIALPVMAEAKSPLPLKQIKYLFALKGESASPLSLPSDVAVDDEGLIYVVDSGNHRIVVFNHDGDTVTSISQQGQNQGDLLNPVGIDVDKNTIYVADKDNHRIQVFEHNGTYVNSIPLKQGNKLIRPVDVAISRSEKLLYITGNNNHQVMVYDFTGKPVRHWGGEGTNRGELRYPATLSLYNNNIFVVDVLNSRVQIFNNQGELQVIAGEWGILPGQLFRPKGVALDQEGNIFISDSYLGLIQVFTADSRFQSVLADKANAHKFTTPVGITIDQHNRLYVCEMLKNQVSVYSLEP